MNGKLCILYHSLLLPFHLFAHDAWPVVHGYGDDPGPILAYSEG